MNVEVWSVAAGALVGVALHGSRSRCFCPMSACAGGAEAVAAAKTPVAAGQFTHAARGAV